MKRIGWRLWMGLAVMACGAGGAMGAEMVDVTGMGVVGDGETVNTAAIQKGIDEAAAKGGAVLRFPAGRYVTGTIQLKDNVRLHLEKGAMVLGAVDAKAYRNLDPFMAGDGIPQGYALIVAADAKNVGLTGEGTIDGRGKEVKAAQGRSYTVRPFLIRWLRCTDVTVSGLTLTGPGAWTMHFFQCKNARAEGLTIRSRQGIMNNDGIDVDSCKGVRIEGCDIDSGDDAICLKATSPIACEDVEVKGCTLSTACNGIKLGTESIGDFTKVRVSGMKLNNIGMAGIALYCVDGGKMTDIEVAEVEMRRATVAVSVRLGARLKTFREGDVAKLPGELKDVTLRGIKAAEVRRVGVLVNGVPGHAVENLTLRDVAIEVAGGGKEADAKIEFAEKEQAYPEWSMFGQVFPGYGMYLRHVRGVTLERVKVVAKEADARPMRVLVDVEGLVEKE